MAGIIAATAIAVLIGVIIAFPALRLACHSEVVAQYMRRTASCRTFAYTYGQQPLLSAGARVWPIPGFFIGHFDAQKNHHTVRIVIAPSYFNNL
jgi:hypothetical protein